MIVMKKMYKIFMIIIIIVILYFLWEKYINLEEFFHLSPGFNVVNDIKKDYELKLTVTSGKTSKSSTYPIPKSNTKRVKFLVYPKPYHITVEIIPHDNSKSYTKIFHNSYPKQIIINKNGIKINK